jgi:hypothetical protein
MIIKCSTHRREEKRREEKRREEKRREMMARFIWKTRKKIF